MYYYKHNYVFTAHSLNRIRQRINLTNKEEFALKDEVIGLIESSVYNFESSNHLYIRYKNTNIFFVIDKLTNAIITATPISHTKMLNLLTK
ncbi:hypothetical protein [Spiroplasma endosymbiont of Aspidapion aeneum]|uniref:hypothetical protein n=1 Tax=Spiroplasma endosymbiont of Aspidapion aeneum TaxID=3066276 RepID=UPI00313AE0B0